MKMQIREATPDDANAIERLYRVLVPGDHAIRVTPERLAEIASDAHNYLLVVDEMGEVCGTAFLTLCLDPMYRSLPYAVIENIVIDEAKRNRGYGAVLMKRVESLCWENGCTKIMFLSSIHRSAAHRFFASLDFRDDQKKAFVKYRSDHKLDAEPTGPCDGVPAAHDP
jgi:N-acetylglutamate synthase-like GNAT family acetyltransferase